MNQPGLKVPECPEQRIIATSQGQLSFRCRGEGEAVIFLHGLLGNSQAWAWQFAGLAPTHHLIAWDAPGYGDSSPVAPDIDAYVQSLHDLIMGSGFSRVSLVGHSMGGTVASRYAARYPGHVNRLILSCTHPGYGAPDSISVSEKLLKRLQEMVDIGREAYGWNRARDLLPFPGIPAPVLAYAAKIAAQTNPEGLTRASRMLQLADNRPLLPLITAPTLILTGEKDRVVQPQLTADLLRLASFTQHIVMPGMAHAPYFQAPDYYNGLLADFLSNN